MITSSLPGGPADKAGTNYEMLWGLHGMLDVVLGHAESIRIEAPGVDGSEFFLSRQGVKEHWQTKRQVTSQENWSLQKLSSEGILQFFRACALAGEHAVFASISDAPELRILSDHARSAESFEEFVGQFLTRPRAKEFQDLQRHLGGSSDCEAFAFLKKVHVRCTDERTLEERFLHPLLSVLFAAPAVSTQANLNALYLASVHQTLRPDDILAHLDKAGIRQREVLSSPTVRAQIAAITTEYIAGQRVKLISGSLVKRSAASEIVARIRGASASLDVLVSSAAGGGKSACFLQIASELTEAGLPVLAFRLDRLQPTLTTAKLGEQMGMVESPALVLARANPRQPVVLIIDQLDVVSTVSGRHPEFFDALAAIVNEVRGLRVVQPVHLVLACRQFDFEHDHRFRQLIGKDDKPVKLEPLTPDEVKAVVTAAGGRPERLTSRQLALLGLAQNLALFLDSKLVQQEGPAFFTQKDLFDAYWDVKRRQAELAQPAHAIHWTPLLDKLTEEMSKRQALCVPKAVLDAFPGGFVNHLVSSGVLTSNGRVCGFGHESFFDYCFARGTVARGEDFATFLEADDQLLFRRAQLRQVLVYLREADPSRYLENLRQILRSAKIRPHLKLLTLELLAALPDATEEEFACLRPLIDSELPHRQAQTINPDKLASRAWEVFFASRTLFPLADRAGLVSGWLAAQDEKLNNLTINYLAWQLHQHADRVAELVKPYEKLPGWRGRLRALVERGELEKGRSYFELVLRLLADGVLDEARAPFHSNGGFWTTVSGLAEAQPEWAAELAARWLDRQVVRALAPAGTRGILLDDDSGVDDLRTAAQNAPRAMLGQVLPAVLRATEALAYDVKGNEGLRWDRAWSERYRSDDLDLSEAYLEACRTAFAAVSAGDPEVLRPYIVELSRHETDTPNRLLFAAYECHPAHFADEALSLLASDSRRLHSALFESRHWRARELIAVCSPYCAEDVFRRIEAAVVNFVPRAERTKQGFRFRGLAAFTLVSGLDAARLAESTRSRLASWKDKLREPDGPPDTIQAYSAVSPINEETAARMSDEHWLRAIRKHHAGRGRNRDDFTRGGAAEFAGVLGAFVAKDPKRFAALAHRFPPEVEPNYLWAVMQNLRDADIPGGQKIAVARLVFDRSPDYAARCALELLGAVGDVPLPADALNFILKMAATGPGPAFASRQEQEAVRMDEEKDPRIDGLNTVRGAAINAMARLISYDRAYIEHFFADLENWAQDASSAIRGCVATAIYATAAHDPDRALKCLPALFDTDFALHGSEFVGRLVKDGVSKNLEAVRPYVHRLLTSPSPRARHCGGRAACLARLYHPEADSLAEAAMTGAVEARLGAAAVAEANLLHRDCRVWCEQALRRLFDDPVIEVRNAAAHCFWKLWKHPEYPITDYARLIEAFLESAAFMSEPTFLLHALEDSKTRLPGEVLQVCETFVRRCAGEARDIRTGLAADDHTVGKLVFRAVAQIPDAVGQRRAVAIIDQMCLEGLHSTRKQLEGVER